MEKEKIWRKPIANFKPKLIERINKLKSKPQWRFGINFLGNFNKNIDTKKILAAWQVQDKFCIQNPYGSYSMTSL